MRSSSWKTLPAVPSTRSTVARFAASSWRSAARRCNAVRAGGGQRLVVQHPHDHRSIVVQQRGLLALEPIDVGGQRTGLARLQ